MSVKTGVFSAFLVIVLSTSGFAWTTGKVTDSAFTSIWVDMYLNYFKYHTEGKTWSDSAKTYLGTNYSHTGDLAFPNQIPWATCGWAIAIDGSDAQVAQTGLTREELIRRVRMDSSHIYIAISLDGRAGLKKAPTTKVPYTRAGFDSIIAKARTVYAAPRVAPTGFGLRPVTAKTLSMGWNQRMDYGNSKNWVTVVFAAQDLADPRLIAGRSVKDWIKNYWWGATSGRGGDYGHNTPYVEPNYAPDFSNDHHGMIHPWYAACHLDQWHTGVDSYLYQQLLSGNNLEEHLTSPYNNLRNLWKWFALLTGPNGWFVEPQTYDEFAPYRTYRDNAWASAIYRDPFARALAARSIEEHAKRKPIMGKPYGHETESDGIASAYWMHRLLGGSDSAASYTDAVKRLHGSYWFRSYKYAVHRTPDKMVVVGWNGRPRPEQGGVGEYWKMQAQGAESLLTVYSIADLSKTYLNTAVIPDNDSLRPSDETAFNVSASIGGTTCMQGFIGNLSYTQHNAVIKNNRSDAVLNTTGFMPFVCGRNSVLKYSAYQYQSFSSFYDKTCISLVQIAKGASPVCGTVNTWSLGFGNGIITDASLGEKRDCSYEQGTLDLTLVNGTQNLTGSKWWSVNGRIGVATKGGNGQFVVKTSGGAKYKPKTSLIAWDETFNSSSSQWANMAAAYYTDTPPDQVKYLQSTLLSLDSLLPVGWKGLVSETPDSQRVMAIARFHSDSGVAKFALTLPEGGPVFEAPTAIRNNNSTVSLAFDSLQTLGQTMAFYVTGETDTVVAEQISDIMVRLKGTGSAKLVYLSRAANSTVDLNGTKSVKTKQELKSGITIALSSSWTVVRVSNWIDEDHSAPAVEVVSPQYYSDKQLELVAEPIKGGTLGFDPLTQPDLVFIPDSGLLVSVMAKDRSGVAWVKLFLDWDSVGVISRDPLEMSAPYTLTIPKLKFDVDSSFHAIHAIACDVFGNVDTSVTVPFRVRNPGGVSAIEHRQAIKCLRSPMPVSGSFVNRAESDATPVLSGKGKATLVSGPDSRVVRGRVQPKAGVSASVSGLAFSHEGVDYVFGLDAVKGKAILFRRNTPMGDAMATIIDL